MVGWESFLSAFKKSVASKNQFLGKLTGFIGCD